MSDYSLSACTDGSLYREDSSSGDAIDRSEGFRYRIRVIEGWMQI